jgi:SSS family solute:Na+ symporter
MAICFFSVLGVMWLIALAKPLAQPVVFQLNTKMNLETSAGAKMFGIGIVVVTLILYVIFSPWGIAK